MLNVGTARRHASDHLVQADADDFEYTRRKTGVPVAVEKAISLKNALTALKRVHFCITTSTGKPFTVDGFSGWMRDAICTANWQPHQFRTRNDVNKRRRT